jgi:putative membrane-bound dehydrogenase-like protein
VSLASFVASAGLLAQGYAPDEAAARMVVPAGFEVTLVASEPLVRQPVAIDFDDRGRLWVLQYLQYPNPAGLKRVKWDRYSRTTYDRVPEPPPRGPRGEDRLTVLEDVDGDGRADRSRDFLSGLNLASAFAFGEGGVFVVQAPYFLFYADRDRDDSPDGDPDVLLAGFGVEDAHSVANSLAWGPDGWLYGAQGSTVTAKVRGVEFQQGVWRYQPRTRGFELVFEGGGNMWGLDFDAGGEMFVSSNVGPALLVHGVPGAYYEKHFSKHGALHNPHAYGWFTHAAHEGARGGHVTVGGVVYQGGSFPAEFRGKFIAANLLAHEVYWHELVPQGSTFRSRHAGVLLDSRDTWFAPSDVTVGPDGAVYVADWHDQRTAHPDPDAEWDRTNGRIYRIQAQGAAPVIVGDLQARSSAELAALLSHPDAWFVRRARRILAERRDAGVAPALLAGALQEADPGLALESLWALHTSSGLEEESALKLFEHSSERVRAWTVRLLGDSQSVSNGIGTRLAAMARRVPSLLVRRELASTAQRLAAPEALRIVGGILERDADAADPCVPLLSWWAVERHALDGATRLGAGLESWPLWDSRLARSAVLGRLARRWTADGSEEGSRRAAELLLEARGSRNEAALETVLAGLDEALSGSARSASEAIAAAVGSLWREGPRSRTLLRLAVRLGVPEALEQAASLAFDASGIAGERAEMIELLGETGRLELVSRFLRLVSSEESETVVRAALRGLAAFDGGEVAAAVLSRYGALQPPIRAAARELLLRRRAWTGTILDEVEAGRIAAVEFSSDEVRRIALHEDALLEDKARRLWGRFRSESSGERLAEVRRLQNDLRAGSGDAAAGRVLFGKLCAPCHRLFGEGGAVGPDLTQANRKDREFLLVSLVDPSAQVRKEYASYTVATKDGQVLHGLVAPAAGGAIEVVNALGERTRVASDRVARVEESEVSLMPEGLLQPLRPQELRDLFDFLTTPRSHE